MFSLCTKSLPAVRQWHANRHKTPTNISCTAHGTRSFGQACAQAKRVRVRRCIAEKADDGGWLLRVRGQPPCGCDPDACDELAPSHVSPLKERACLALCWTPVTIYSPRASACIRASAWLGYRRGDVGDGSKAAGRGQRNSLSALPRNPPYGSRVLPSDQVSNERVSWPASSAHRQYGPAWRKSPEQSPRSGRGFRDGPSIW